MRTEVASLEPEVAWKKENQGAIRNLETARASRNFPLKERESPMRKLVNSFMLHEHHTPPRVRSLSSLKCQPGSQTLVCSDSKVERMHSLHGCTGTNATCYSKED
eukprot:scaffold6454_cov267-Chaetoceros_neogracile.AAC.20